MNIFKDVLPKLDAGDISFILTLSDKEINELQPYILMKFMSAVKDKNSRDYYLIAVNEVVNKKFWELKDYKDLQLLLLSICGIGKKQFHYFPGKSQTESKINKFVGTCFPLWKEEDINMFVEMSSIEDIVSLGKDFGLQDKELDELKDEYEKI